MCAPAANEILVSGRNHKSELVRFGVLSIHNSEAKFGFVTGSVPKNAWFAFGDM